MKGYEEIRGQQFRLVFDDNSCCFEWQPLKANATTSQRKSMACDQHGHAAIRREKSRNRKSSEP